jgi:peptidoglycan/LPS O-acetylase OafA/YrhL
MSGGTIRSNRLVSVDALRGMAALAVVLLHGVAMLSLPENAPFWYVAIYRILETGHWGVPLFFVISGFCIHMTWAREAARGGEGSFHFVSFWKRRLHRLYPPYFVVLCLSMLAIVVAYVVHINLPTISAVYPQPVPRWIAVDFFLHATMLHGLSARFDAGGGNSVFWSLAREEYYYLFYPLLLLLRRRFGVVVTVGSVFLLSAATDVVYIFYGWGPRLLLTFVLWSQWALGMLAVEAYCGLIKLPRWCSSIWVGIPLAMLAAWAVKDHPALYPLLSAVSFFVLLNACVGLDKAGHWPRRGLLGWFSKVGIFSYSLYLVHRPIRAVGKVLVHRLHLPGGIAAQIIEMIIVVVLGFYGGKLFFYLVEKRFLNSPVRAGRNEETSARLQLIAETSAGPAD